MRSAAEINKTFKHNFKRNVEIFKRWILGCSLESISQQYGLSPAHIKSVLRKAERSIMYASAMNWSEMPGQGQLNYMQYQRAENKNFYLELIDNALSVDLDREGDV